MQTPNSIAGLGAATFNMSFEAFRAALELEDDSYARDKYTDFKAIGRAMCAFSNSTLLRLTDAYLKP